MCVCSHLTLQTPSTCVRSSAMKAPVVPALSPPRSGADVVLRPRWEETSAEMSLSFDLTPNNWNAFDFQDVPCATIQREGDLRPPATDQSNSPSAVILTPCVPDELVFTCERRCHKKRSCGRHKCGELCCVVSLCTSHTHLIIVCEREPA